jgi:hypothetical protein
VEKCGKIGVQVVRMQGRAWGGFGGSNTMHTQLSEVVKELVVLDIHQKIKVVKEICT